MASFLRPAPGGEPACVPTPAEARAGTRVAIGFPLLATVLTLAWLAGESARPALSFWTMLVLPAICAGYGLFQVVVGARARFSFELPTILLAGLAGGPLAGVLAGVATGLGDVRAVWRRRSTYAGLAMLQGFAAVLAGDAWRTGGVSLPVAVALTAGAAFAIGRAGHMLVFVDRRCRPLPSLLRLSALDLAEVVLSAPLVFLLAGSHASSPGVVSMVAASALAIVGVCALTGEGDGADGGRQAPLLDPLTGALSRTAFEAALAREQERVLRGERSTGLVICDIDRFGRFNERFGHLGGDRALRFVVEQIQGAVRAGDLVARWGGEEICVIAPGMGSLAELEALCERIRLSVAGAALLMDGEQVSLAVSAGATLLTDWSSPAETFSRADEALYLAKRSRNAVAVLEPRPDPGESRAWALAGA